MATLDGVISATRERFKIMAQTTAEEQDAAVEDLKRKLVSLLGDVFPNSWEIANRGDKVAARIIALLEQEGWSPRELKPADQPVEKPAVA